MEISQYSPGDWTLDDAQQMLDFISSDLPYKEWAAIGRALASEFGDAAESLFISWSNPAPKEKRSVESQWRSLSRDPRKVTIGTLVHMAKQAGWSPGERRQLSDQEKANWARKKAQREAERAEQARRQAIEDAENLAVLEKVFAGLPRYTGIDSHYLARKGVALAHPIVDLRLGQDVWIRNPGGDDVCVSRAPGAPLRPGERPGKCWVGWALRNGAGEFQGFERLYDHLDHKGRSVKRVAPGTRPNAGWLSLGNLESARRIFVTGGFADAIPAHLATDEAVANAVGEGNIPSIVRLLQQAYPDAQIIAAPDNDKAGVEAAQACGGFWTVPQTEGSDWNDVFLDHGIDEVKRQLTGFIRGFETRQSCTQYLDLQVRPGLNLVKSAKETGKSTGVVRFVQENPQLRCLIISYRVLLNRQLAAELDADLYLDLISPGTGDYLLKSAQRLVITPDSLWRIAGTQWDMVFFDEAQQGLIHFDAHTMSHKSFNLKVLASLLKTSDFQIIADADMSDLTFEFCRQIGLHSGTYHHNTYQPRRGSVMYLYSSRDQLKQSMTDYLNTAKRLRPERVGGRFLADPRHPLHHRHLVGRQNHFRQLINELQECRAFLFSNSKTAINNLAKTLELSELDRVVSITSDNSRSEEVLQFIAQVRDRAGDVRALLGSPSIGTGFSVPASAHRISRTYGILTANSGTSEQGHQGLARVRGVNEYHVFVDPTERTTETRAEELRRLLLDKPTEESAQFLSLNDEGEVDFIDPLYEWLYGEIQAHKALSKNNYRGRFLAQARAEGYTIIEVEEDEAQKDLGELNTEIAKSHLEAEWRRAVVASTILYEEDDYHAAKTGEIEADRATLAKSTVYHEFNFAACNDDNFEEQINHLAIEEEDNRFASRLKKLSSTMISAETTRKMDAINRKHAANRADLKHYSMTRRLQNRLLAAAGLNEALEYDDTEWSHESTRPLRQWLQRNRENLFTYAGVNITFETLRNPVRWFNEYLRSRGLEVCSRQVRQGKNRVWYYRLDRVHLKRIRPLLEQRVAGIEEHFASPASDNHYDPVRAAVTKAEQDPVATAESVTPEPALFIEKSGPVVTPAESIQAPYIAVCGGVEEGETGINFSPENEPVSDVVLDLPLTPEIVLERHLETLSLAGLTIKEASHYLAPVDIADLHSGVMTAEGLAWHLQEQQKRAAG